MNFFKTHTHFKSFFLAFFVFVPFVGFTQSETSGDDSKKETPAQSEEKKPGDAAKKNETKGETKDKTPGSSSKTSTDKGPGATGTESKPDTNETESKPQTPPSKDTSSEKKTSSSKSAGSTLSDSVETLEVTGSYIRRSDIEGPSPIIVFNRDQIENSGFDSVGDFLARNSTVIPFGGGGLKGLGSVRTLVLINGQRAPAGGSSYSSGAVSTDIIPLAAVERVEILKDGASATYGSDALGGVINIITRKNWDGMAVVAKLNVADYKGDDSLRTSMAYGKSSSRGNFLTSFQYVHSTALRRSDLKRIAHYTDIRPQFSSNYITSEGLRPIPSVKDFFQVPRDLETLGMEPVLIMWIPNMSQVRATALIG